MVKVNDMQRIKLKPTLFTQMSVLIITLCLASTVGAFGFIIGEAQVNAMLGMTFPYKTQVGNNHITLSEPKPHFYEKTQQVGIALNISLKDRMSGQIMEAKTLVKGGIRFDNKAQQLQLIKPQVASLDWQGDTTASNDAMVKQVSQLVGQDLPVIVLLDIKQLTGNALTPTLSAVNVKKAGIEVVF